MFMKIARPGGSLRLSQVWFWTLELAAMLVIAICWTSTIVPAVFPWNPLSVFSFLFDFSSGLVGLLLVTACLFWRRQRKLAIVGLVLCLAWLAWAELPRFAASGSGF